jgi:hypothetical protein
VSCVQKFAGIESSFRSSRCGQQMSVAPLPTDLSGA